MRRRSEGKAGGDQQGDPEGRASAIILREQNRTGAALRAEQQGGSVHVHEHTPCALHVTSTRMLIAKAELGVDHTAPGHLGCRSFETSKLGRQQPGLSRIIDDPLRFSGRGEEQDSK